MIIANSNPNHTRGTINVEYDLHLLLGLLNTGINAWT